MTWNPGVFSLIRNLSETVVLPIAGIVLTFVATYELIQLIIEKNNLHDVDTWIFFKWIFKTAIAVLILSNTFDAVMAVFDVAQSVISSAGRLIQGSTAVTPGMLATLEADLMAMDIGPLIGLWLQSFIIQIVVAAINIVVFVIVYGRMIEIYLLSSLAPIPFATLSNREFGSMGQNYFKSLCAVGFQGLLMLVCVGIYTVHPTQKPVELCEYLIKTYTDEGNLVVDICAGSGTTAVAAINTGRRFICFESAAPFYALAAERIRKAIAVTSGQVGPK